MWRGAIFALLIAVPAHAAIRHRAAGTTAVPNDLEATPINDIWQTR